MDGSEKTPHVNLFMSEESTPRSASTSTSTDLSSSLDTTLSNQSVQPLISKNFSSDEKIEVAIDNESDVIENIKLKSVNDDLDDVIGHLGIFQWLMAFCTLLLKLTNGAHGVMPVFANAEMEHRCRTCLDGPNLETDSAILSLSQRNMTDNCGRQILDQCSILSVALSLENATDDTCSDNIIQATSNQDLTANDYVSCKEFIYTSDTYDQTIVSEFNLVCDRKTLPDLTISIYWLGYAIGGIVGSTICSKIGRTLTTKILAFSLFSASMYSAYAPDITQYTISRFLVGFLSAGIEVSNYSFLMELAGYKYRTLVNLLWGYTFSISALIMSYPLALLIRDWRKLHMAVAFLGLPGLCFAVFFQCESWRWLASQGKSEEATEVACKIASFQQGLDLSQKRLGFLPKMKQLSAKKQRIIQENISILVRNNIKIAASKRNQKYDSNLENYKNLFKHSWMNRYTLNLTFTWFVVNMVYHGTVLSAKNLPGSDIFHNAIFAVMDMPAVTIMLFLLDRPKIGRKRFTAAALAGGGVTYLVATFLLNSTSCSKTGDISPLRNGFGLAFAYIAKFFVAAALQANLQHTAEIYCTDIRPEGMAVCSLGSRIGGVIAPFILSLSDVYGPLPGLIFGALGLVNAMTYLFLPETLGEPMRLKVGSNNHFQK